MSCIIYQPSQLYLNQVQIRLTVKRHTLIQAIVQINAKERGMILCQDLKILECQKILTEMKTLAIFMILYMKICSMNRPQQLKPKSAKQENKMLII